jgi:hypothetical protein
MQEKKTVPQVCTGVGGGGGEPTLYELSSLRFRGLSGGFDVFILPANS